MNIEFTVHGAVRSNLNKLVKIGHETLCATVGCLEVELTPTDGNSGTFVFRAVGEAVDEAVKLFPPGATVTFKVK